VFPKNVLHASLVRNPCVPETKGHCNVAIHVEWGDERSYELVGLLHFDLVVARICNKVVGWGLLFALLVLLLPVVLLRAPAGARRILFLALPFFLVATKDGTNCLLAGGEVGDNIHQTVGSDGSAAAQFSNQLFAGGTREEGHDDIGVGDVRELGVLLRETSNVILEGFAWLLFAASEIP
jgi:hypothetical protein